MRFEVEIIASGEMLLPTDANLSIRAQDGISKIEGINGWSGLHHLKAGAVVIDVGAFIGDTAIWPLQQGYEVHAIEPFVDAYTCLLFNTAKYRPLAHCYCRACGNGEKVIMVQEAHGRNLGMRYVLDDANGEPTLRLDDTFKACDFLKIDCEGRECQVLDGAATLIANCRPKMLIEVFPELLIRAGHSGDELHDKVRNMGYNLQISEIGVPRWDIWCDPV